MIHLIHHNITMTLDYNDTHRTSFKCPDTHRDLLDDVADDRGISRSQLLRDIVAEFVDNHTEDDSVSSDLPDEQKLREAYLTLLEMAERHPQKRVTLEQARNHLWTTSTPKKAVKDDLLTPLRRQGLIRITPGMDRVWVTVRPRAQTTTEATA